MAQHTDFSVAAIGWLATDYPFHRHLQGHVPIFLKVQGLGRNVNACDGCG